MNTNQCKNCGKELEKIGNEYICKNCNKRYTRKAIVQKMELNLKN